MKMFNFVEEESLVLLKKITLNVKNKNLWW